VQDKESTLSFLRSLRVVAWSFIGIRSGSGYREDLAKVKPLHVVLVGLAGALLLVVGLMNLAKWVVGV
jgi:sulfite exporter TauE/SafE